MFTRMATSSRPRILNPVETSHTAAFPHVLHSRVPPVSWSELQIETSSKAHKKNIWKRRKSKITTLRFKIDSEHQLALVEKNTIK